MTILLITLYLEEQLPVSHIYQLPLILTALLQVDLINIAYLRLT